LWVLGICARFASTGFCQDEDGDLFFERRVRPILVERCVACHGERKQEGGLRLDSRNSALAGGDAGAVIEPGRPAESVLVDAIRREGPIAMPPKEALSESEIAVLVEWIRRGAPWPESTSRNAESASTVHWSLAPLRTSDESREPRPDWRRTPIDSIIAADLVDHAIEPAREADRRTLLRRLSFDLLGLPPSAEEVDAFNRDTRPDAYERVVDRLLASPHYGERWGRHWLDLARYSDTKGYVFLQDSEYPWAFTYRDYVIEAMNEDRPYDRFIVDQLAADLALPETGDRRSLRALGFLTVGGRYLNNPHDIIDDRIDVTTRGLMGLTVGCARCHDHKFDPISQRDYYALYGVFASSQDSDAPALFADPEESEQARAHARELAAREVKLKEFVNRKRDELERATLARFDEYLMAIHAMKGQPSTDSFMQIAGGNELNPTMLARWRAALERSRREGDPLFASWLALEALPDLDFSERAAALMGQPAESHRPLWDPLIAVALAEARPRDLRSAARVYGTLFRQSHAIWKEHEARARLEQREPSPLPNPLLEAVAKRLRGSDSALDLHDNPIEDIALLPDRASQDELKKLRDRLAEWRDKGAGAPPRAMTVADSGRPVEPRVFRRGNPNQPGDAVPRRFLSVLGGSDDRPLSTQQSGRLELARAIVDPANPLTARVIANRVWHHHMGRGVVETPSDFGTRGSPPSNPSLLDRLASELMRGGWSLKSLHRLIVCSGVYRMGSNGSGDSLTSDAENRHFGRAHRRRLDFEAMRDSLLAVSGRLEARIGGPSFAEIGSPNAARRTLYARIDRQELATIYRTFDFPDPATSSPMRDETTVPPQALFWLNHGLVARAASALASATESIDDPDQRIGTMFRRVLARPPTDGERGLARDFLGAPIDPAAWTRLAQALLMTNEFVMID
jgi:hypothetical protein